MIFYRQICVCVSLIFIITTKPLCQIQIHDSLLRPLGFVNDFEDIFSATQEKYLDSMIRVYEKKTTIQIAIITIDSSLVSRKDFADYILQLAKAWAVGQKGKDNGIAIGISKSYRTMRIENGYGIESVLSDIETKKIIDTVFIPPFKRGEYFEGVVNGLRAIMDKLD